MRQTVQFKPGRWRAIAVALTMMAAMVIMAGGAPSAQAADGNILPPFNVGETWWICQGYNNAGVSHSGTSAYGLDLTGGPNCNNSASGRTVKAPMAGTVYYYQASFGNLCVNVAGGRSYTLTHIDSGITGGTVSAGQVVGTVAAPGSRGNANVAHIHFQMWATPNCYSSPGIPYDAAHGTRICGAPNLTASGPNGGNGTWSGLSFVGAVCGTSGSPGYANASPSVGVITPNGLPHVFPVKASGAVHELQWTGSYWASQYHGMTAANTVASTSLVMPNGNPHVYSVTDQGAVYEAYWTGSQWVMQYVGATAPSVTSISSIVGPDNWPHVYTTTASGGVYETYWMGTQWVSGQISTTAPNTVASSSMVNSNGLIHIYSATSDGKVYETYYNNSWIVQQVGTVPSGVTSLSAIVGGDNWPHVYTTTASGGVYETYWMGTQWVSGFVGQTAANTVASSTLRTPNGLLHVYSVTSDGKVYETHYTGSYWAVQHVGNVAAGATAIAALVTPDGLPHAFTVNGSSVYETQWTGSQWVSGFVGSY